MDARYIGETEFKQISSEITPELALAYFKLVTIGPNTINFQDGRAADIANTVEKQHGFFLVGADNSQLRESMHQLVDRMFDNA